MKDPALKIRPAQPPPAWNRRVLFFSNIHSIFYGNTKATRQLVNEITGAHSYGGRVIAILDLLFSRQPNVMVLETAPEPSLIRYLQGIGLSMPQQEILDRRAYDRLAAARNPEHANKESRRFRRLREHPAEWVDGFVTDANLVRIAELLGKETISTLPGSKKGNNKYLLYCHQVEVGLPVFETLTAADQSGVAAALGQLRDAGYRKAVIKAQIGASGFGMSIVSLSDSPTAAAPEFLFFEGSCMVQGWIEDGVLGMRKLASPSVQMFLDDNNLVLFDMTEQILSEQSVHQGNLSPPPVAGRFPDVESELWRQAAIAGTWLHRQGYRGTGSVDFLIIERDGRRQTIICEINARVTGATYPAFLARHFKPNGDWLMRNISFRKALNGADLIALMERGRVLFDPKDNAGILPFNFNTDAEGKVLKGQFVCIGDRIDDCKELLDRAWTQLPVEWGYDRD